MKAERFKSDIAKLVSNWEYDFEERYHGDSEMRTHESLLLSALNLLNTYDTMRSESGLKVVYDRVDGEIKRRVVPWNAGTECDTSAQKGD